MHAINIQDLSIKYGEHFIFNKFSATISAGEFIGIFGPNGAGKSTLLRAILGLVTGNQGLITIFDAPIQGKNRLIGYLPQSRQIIVNNQLSARARLSVVLQGLQWGITFKCKQHQLIDSALEEVGATEYADRPFVQLSGGERQRLMLAQALLCQPKILLLDEPLNNLDPKAQEQLIQLIQTIRTKQKLTVLFTTHDINPLLGIMDRIIYLAHGKAVIGTAEEIITADTLSWLYDTPIEVIHYQNHLFVINKKTGISHAVQHHNNA